MRSLNEFFGSFYYPKKRVGGNELEEGKEYLVLRVSGCRKGCLKKYGEELFRTKDEYYNDDINVKISAQNKVYKGLAKENMLSEYYSYLKDSNISDIKSKNTYPVIFIVISASLSFMEKLGWRTGGKPTEKIEGFMDDAYKFLVNTFGYNGEDGNILGAVVHYDEKTPHLQAYFIPVTDWKIRKDVEMSNILDKNKKGILENHMVKRENTEISFSSLLQYTTREYGGIGISSLYDKAHEELGKLYGLSRGEKFIHKKHVSKLQFDYRNLINNIKRGNEMMEELRDRVYILVGDKNRIEDRIDEKRRELRDLEVKTERKKLEYEALKIDLWNEVYSVYGKDEEVDFTIENDEEYHRIRDKLPEEDRDILNTKNILFKRSIIKNSELKEENDRLKLIVGRMKKDCQDLKDLKEHYPSVVGSYLKTIARERGKNKA